MTAAAAALSAAALLVWAALVEPRRLVLRRAVVIPPGWPGELDGLRVAVLGDFHAGGPHKRPEDVRRVAERVAAEGPDLVLLIGDFVDFSVRGHTRVPLEAVAAALAPLTAAPLGAVAVLGNHDWAHGGRRLARALTAQGIRVLENEAAPTGEDGLWVAGVADMRFRDPDVNAALAAVPEDAAVLALFHDPDVWPQVPARVALSVAGHTHGGQIAVPGLRLLFVPSRRPRRYLGGLVREGRRLLWVTSGLGEAGWPVRLLTPPEAVLLTLRRGEGAGGR